MISNIQPQEVTLTMDMNEPWRLAWLKQPKPKRLITLVLPVGQVWPGNARKGREIELDFVIDKERSAHISGTVTHRRMRKLVIEGVLTQYTLP
jgi:hypothetical protein